MSAFDWAGGPLDDPSSWTPQPPPPNPPVIPGPADDAFFAGGGSLTGSLGVADARFTAGSFDLQGAITATFNINLGADTGSSATDLMLFLARLSQASAGPGPARGDGSGSAERLACARTEACEGCRGRA